MMSKVTVLFFAADPLSAPPAGAAPRLRLDDEMRQIQRKVRAAEHRDALEFEFRPAARTDDLLQALSETPPQVVHFSGHGGSEGLILASRDGTRAHPVDAAVLAQLFKVFRGDIRLVVLSACYSRPQAQAIAAVVGCAIGTHGTISDEAAITFSASFYRAIAFGRSVQAAYDQARTALALEHFPDRECPELVVGAGVDPAKLVLVPRGAGEPDVQPAEVDAGIGTPTVSVAEGGGRAPGTIPRRPAGGGVRRVMIGATALVLSAGAIMTAKEVGEARSDDGSSSSSGRVLPVMPQTQQPAQDPAIQEDEDLTAGRALHAAGNYAEAFPRFLAAAERGSAEAMAYVGIAYLDGEGVARDPRQAIFWIRKSVEKRDARGMNARGVAYQRGVGEQQSNRWAKHWFEVAATEKGYPPAMRNLAAMYRAEETDSSYAVALHWYREAASAGSADAMADLGLMYEEGWGVPAAPDSALWWYEKAADAGSAAGMVRAGQLYQHRGDYAAARQWYDRGAAAGSADAMNNLGVLYHQGLGVRRNRDEALRWFRRAADAGSAVAAGNLAALDEG